MATPKTEATQDTKKMMIAAQAKLKNSSDTGSWGTSCLSPPFNQWACMAGMAPRKLKLLRQSVEKFSSLFFLILVENRAVQAVPLFNNPLFTPTRHDSLSPLSTSPWQQGWRCWCVI